MTTGVRLKISTPKIVMRTAPRLGAYLQGASPVLVAFAAGIYTVSLDINALATALSQSFQPLENNDQHVTAGPSVNVNANANTVRVDQIVSGAITLNLPAAASKVAGVVVVDWKGDAGANNITIVPSGTEKINGLSQWVIAANNGSVFLRPIVGVGYVI
jgi:hypothetical protein